MAFPEPTQAQLDFFNGHGWLVVEDAIPQADLDEFLRTFVRGAVDPSSYQTSITRLAVSLERALPSGMQGQRLGIPSAFSRLDLTHFDALELGRSAGIDDEPVAAVRQRPGERQPEAAGGSGDDGCGHAADGTSTAVPIGRGNWS